MISTVEHYFSCQDGAISIEVEGINTNMDLMANFEVP